MAEPTEAAAPPVEDRYLCRACGNRTRFDVTEVVRRRLFCHYTLGGDLNIDEETILERQVEAVTCRWCDRSDAITPLGR
jgi:hypothetical protein